MLCKTCPIIIRDLDLDENSRDAFRLRNHHISITSLSTAAQDGCYICFHVLGTLRVGFAEAVLLMMDDHELLLTWNAQTGLKRHVVKIHLSDKVDPNSRPWSFFVVPAKRKEGLSDFKFSGLKTNAIQARHRIYEKIASTTGSPSVGELAKH
jgi:hypothetical protein